MKGLTYKIQRLGNNMLVIIFGGRRILTSEMNKSVKNEKKKPTSYRRKIS